MHARTLSHLLEKGVYTYALHSLRNYVIVWFKVQSLGQSVDDQEEATKLNQWVE